MFDRARMLARLAGEDFDVVVIGGGITGAGVALDAASRGLRTALVERHDFAAGTSSKSSKLVHGGLRYLQQGDVRLVYEALHERQRLRRNAPHLVHVLPFLIPVFGNEGVLPTKLARAFGSALWMYDLTGGWRIGRVHRRLRADAAYAHVPTLPTGRVACAYLYYDAQADDARLTLAVARTAAAHGAAVANGCRVTGLHKDDAGHVTAVEVDADGRPITIRTRSVVNATGVWADDVVALDDASAPRTIRPAKGIHLVLPWTTIRNDIAVVVPVRNDRRSLFVVPWGDNGDGTFQFTYVGTTDTDYDGPIDDPQCTPQDVAYIIAALNASITTGISAADVMGTWAGLRPLVDGASSSGRTADLSRRHRVTVAESGVVSVVGGKLTTYRRMAEDAVDAVARHLGVRARCRTRRLRLVGVPADSAAPAHLRERYGSEAVDVLALVAADPGLGAPLVPGLPYLRAEAVFAARHEMARSVDDVLSRRTRARLLDRHASAEAADEVARLIGPELGWDGVMMAASADDFRAAVAHEIAAEGAAALDSSPP
jgi:glycerol-3-phosphate dehydrogenase